MVALYRAIWRVSGKRQIVLVLLSIAIAALAAAPLKFQQDIVNLLTDRSYERVQLVKLCAGMMGVILLSLKWVMGYRSQVLGEDVIRYIRKLLLLPRDRGRTSQRVTPCRYALHGNHCRGRGTWKIYRRCVCTTLHADWNSHQRGWFRGFDTAWTGFCGILHYRSLSRYRSVHAAKSK